MGTVKVGDKVRVVDNNSSHQFDLGSIVTVTEVLGDIIRSTDGVVKWYLDCDEYEPIAPERIVVGGEYTSENGNKFKCIYMDGDYAWLASVHSRGIGTAHRFRHDGTNVDLNDDYNIKFAPVVETVTALGSINKCCDSDGFITYHELHGDHKFNMTVDFIDGKPDWSTAKVTGA